MKSTSLSLVVYVTADKEIVFIVNIIKHYFF